MPAVTTAQMTAMMAPTMTLRDQGEVNTSTSASIVSCSLRDDVRVCDAADGDAAVEKDETDGDGDTSDLNGNLHPVAGFVVERREDTHSDKEEDFDHETSDRLHPAMILRWNRVRSGASSGVRHAYPRKGDEAGTAERGEEDDEEEPPSRGLESVPQRRVRSSAIA